MKSRHGTLAGWIIVVVLAILGLFFTQALFGAAPYKKKNPGDNVNVAVYEPSDGSYYAMRGATGTFGMVLASTVPLAATNSAYIEYSVPAGASASTNLNPGFTAGKYCALTRSTQTVRIAVNDTATSGYGFPMTPLTVVWVCEEGLSFDTFTAFNEGALAATMSIEFWEVPEL